MNGTVTDSTGAVLPQATVKIHNVATNFQISADTRSDGSFSAVDLPIGSLEVFWLDAYGGGVFLPFRDLTSGKTTYGGGRYLLDTAKGADLGGDGGTLRLDFNFAYHPSCHYDPQLVCPLAPPANRLAVAIEAGELTYPGASGPARTTVQVPLK